MADVTVRADGNNRHYNYRHRDVVQLADKLTAYSYAYDGTSHMSYNKTTDGGANWGPKVNIQNEDFVRRFDVWYDKWTPGDTGNLIHMAILESDTDDVWYINLDPDDSDALSTKKQVFDGATVGRIKSAFGNIPEIILGFAGDAYRAARSLGANIYLGVKEQIVDLVAAIKGLLNGIIGHVESAINSAIRAYNKVANLPLNPLPSQDSISLPRLHSGTSFVPETGNYLLERGERVVSARENARGAVTNNNQRSAEVHVHFEGPVTFAAGDDEAEAAAADVGYALVRELRARGVA